MARTQRSSRALPWSRARVGSLAAAGLLCVAAAGSPALAAAAKKRPSRAPAAVKAPAPKPPPPAPPAPQVGVVISESYWKMPFRCEEILMQADGRILLSCRENLGWKMLLARLDPEGRPELSFGGRGYALVDLMYGAVALGSDGKILAAGSRGSNQVGVARLTAEGLPDPGFGSGGTVHLSLGAPRLGAVFYALAAQGDGKVLAAGYAHIRNRGGRYSPFWDIVVLRLLPGGEPDPSFGERGMASVFIGLNGSESARALAVGADGRLTVAVSTFAGLAPQPAAPEPFAVHGTAGEEHKGPHFGLARLMLDGTLDPRFAAAGRSAFVFGRVGSEPRSLTQLPDGKLLAAGVVEYSRSDGAQRVVGLGIARFTKDGFIDPSFGAGGSVDTPLCAGGSSAKPIAVQPDGKIVLACPAAPDPGDHRPAADRQQLVLMRYSADGALDAGFGEGGIVRARVLGGPVATTAVAIPADGGILVLCSGRDLPPAADGAPRGKSVAALVRFNADGGLDPTFGAAPR